jgi:serine-type D-Ala-D-Ala endopeptidase (penicillin-binding protein 7)
VLSSGPVRIAPALAATLILLEHAAVAATPSVHAAAGCGTKREQPEKRPRVLALHAAAGCGTKREQPEKRPRVLGLAWPHLRSESVVVRFADTKEILISKSPELVRPIASVTKLLSGLVLSGLQEAPADDAVTISEDDKDRLKWSRSRIKVGTVYKLPDLFAAALGASDNRAMYATVRGLGLSRGVFVDRMNALARELGMEKSSFVDPAGIDPSNVSTANDLLILLEAAANSEPVRSRTQLPYVELVDAKDRTLVLYNPDRLVRSSSWDVVVGKTGYTVEAGRSLVVRTTITERPVDMVFLGAREMASVFGDAGRVRRWIEERQKSTFATAE